MTEMTYAGGPEPAHSSASLVVPADFPRAGNAATVPGAQSKFVATLTDGVYRTGASQEEHQFRYALCREYIDLLPDHCSRQVADHPEYDPQEVLDRVGRALARKHGHMTGLEVDYILERVAQACGWAWTAGPLWR